VVALLKDYPLKGLTDSRTAMAERLRDFVAALVFKFPKTGTGFRFQKVYEEWAEFRDRAMSGGGKLPAAAVLPERPIPEAASFGPRIIESTWSGGDPSELKDNGDQRFPLGTGAGDGFALYEVAQRQANFLLLYRTKTKTQRRAIQKVLEEAFIEDGALLPDPSSLNPDVVLNGPEEPVPTPQVPDAFVQPVRYGRILRVPRYYNQAVRFTLTSGPEPLDTDASALENRWIGQAEISSQMRICAVRRVRAMSARVELVVDGTSESRGVE
jgi:hypothetical protein